MHSSNQDPLVWPMSWHVAFWVGYLQGERVIASPIYKQHFICGNKPSLEEQSRNYWYFQPRIENGKVLVSPTPPEKTYISSNGQNAERLKLVLVGKSTGGYAYLEDLLDIGARSL